MNPREKFSGDALCAADLQRFELLFGRTVIELFPCAAVCFLARRENVPEPPAESADRENPAVPEAWVVGAGMVESQARPVVDGNSKTLYLPIWQDDRVLGTAILTGCDSALFQVSESWLVDRSRLVSREFGLVKRWSVELTTGLLNEHALLSLLEILLGDVGDEEQVRSDSLSLVLIEVYPQVKDAEAAAKHVRRVADYLDAVLGRYAPLHYLGGGLFGVVLNGLDLEATARMGKMILGWLRQEGVTVCHLGLNTFTRQDFVQSASSSRYWAKRVVEETRTALGRARQRGNFSLFNYATIRNPALHPLPEPPADLLAAFRSLWRGQERFVIVLVADAGHGQGETAAAVAGAVKGVPTYGGPTGERYIYLAGYDGERAKQWADQLRSTLEQVDSRLSLTIGLAPWPCLDFSKSATLLNSRKALIHARLLGPGRTALFDAVSLNVSGDIFYDEGDLVQATCEYRRGLRLNPENCNLLNSLAVCYLQLNRRRQAISLFEKVLELQGDDFMALFNLGHSYLQEDRVAEAVAYFERALAEDNQHFDLLLQLGRLYCRLGRYRDAVRLLRQCDRLAAQAAGAQQPRQPAPGASARDGHDHRSRGLVLRSLAEAYQGLGEKRQAIACLQRANRFAPTDAETLSLLGLLYQEAGEGEGIAESLCSQAITLDEGNGVHWFRLARIRFAQQKTDAAVKAMQECLRRRKRDTNALVFLGTVYESQGKNSQACRCYQRALRLTSGTASPELKKKVKRCS